VIESWWKKAIVGKKVVRENTELPIAHCPLPIAHCPLPIAHCPL
jgi:hypothetical protein